jgi:antitoxin MazE
MHTQIRKWGNSLALRIPRSLAGQSGLMQGSEVELTIEDGRLIVKPISSWEVELQELLDRMDPDSLHGEIDFGPPVGNEAW